MSTPIFATTKRLVCNVFAIYTCWSPLHLWTPVWKQRKAPLQSVTRARSNAPAKRQAKFSDKPHRSEAWKKGRKNAQGALLEKFPTFQQYTADSCEIAATFCEIPKDSPNAGKSMQHSVTLCKIMAKMVFYLEKCCKLMHN